MDNLALHQEYVHLEGQFEIPGDFDSPGYKQLARDAVSYEAPARCFSRVRDAFVMALHPNWRTAGPNFGVEMHSRILQAIHQEPAPDADLLRSSFNAGNFSRLSLLDKAAAFAVPRARHAIG